MSLTEREVQDLAVTVAALLAGRCDGAQAVATTAAQVEAIVARHIEAFRAELVAAIEAEAEARLPEWLRDNYAAAARIVATHQQPPTPPEATALRVEGGGGR